MDTDAAKRLQARLGVRADGEMDPVSYAALFAAVARRAVGEKTAALGRGAAAQFARHGIDANTLRLAHFIAQGAVETGGFVRFEENLSYSAKRLCAVWPGRFPSLDHAESCANAPEALAERVYGKRMGNDADGDGWRYRGRGLPMLTGRANYEEAARLTGLDLVDNPDLAAAPEASVAIMCGYWSKRGINALADRDDARAVRKAINGGAIGIEEAKTWLGRAKQVLL